MPFLIIYASAIIKVKIAQKKLAIYYITRLRQCQMKVEIGPESSSFPVGGISESRRLLLTADSLTKDGLALIGAMLYHIQYEIMQRRKIRC